MLYLDIRVLRALIDLNGPDQPHWRSPPTPLACLQPCLCSMEVPDVLGEIALPAFAAPVWGL